MKNGMSLEALLTEVVRQNETKRDYVANTQEALRMEQYGAGQTQLVLHKEGSGGSTTEVVERFAVAENAHRQIASRLGVPWKYYQRLLEDHPDLVVHQVNALFEREPETRLLRTLDGTARAFLSDRFRRLDNAQVLENVLPSIVKGDIPTSLLSSNVGDNKMHLKVLFTDDSLAIDLGATNGTVGRISDYDGHVDFDAQHNVIARRDAGRDIVRPGAIISNSETGHGSLSVKGFLFRGYCLNGLVWGMEDVFSYSRNHIGGKIIEGDCFEVFSDETKRKQDELIIAEVHDTLHTMIDPQRVQAMGQRLRAIQSGDKVQDSFAAVDALAKEVDLREGEKQGVLESFLRDSDFSQWGMVNAVTEQANKESVSYERACELEQIGAQIVQLNPTQWKRIAEAEKLAA